MSRSPWAVVIWPRLSRNLPRQQASSHFSASPPPAAAASPPAAAPSSPPSAAARLVPTKFTPPPLGRVSLVKKGTLERLRPARSARTLRARSPSRSSCTVCARPMPLASSRTASKPSKLFIGAPQPPQRQERAERQLVLRALAGQENESAADQAPRERPREQRQHGQLDAEKQSHHRHHFDVAEAHGFDLAQPVPDFAQSEQQPGPEQRPEQGVGQGDDHRRLRA